jgi:CubicO group peptidase (beta-lactamase class C family)
VLVVSSGGAARDDKGLPLWFRRILIPLFMNDLYRDMKVMEDMFRATELDWTIVRASYLKDGPGGGDIRISDGSNPSGGWKLSRHDLAAFVAAQLNTGEWSQRLPTLAQ